jgi:hypothetical protein
MESKNLRYSKNYFEQRFDMELLGLFDHNFANTPNKIMPNSRTNFGQIAK